MQSRLFSLDQALAACSTQDSARITTGAQGDHISRIQTALFLLDGVSVAPGELQSQTYGPSTAAAVLAYKRRRNIVNRAYPTASDAIVGKATIASMDREVAAIEKQVECLPGLSHSLACA